MIREAAAVFICAATPHLSNTSKCLAKLTSQWRWIYIFISTAKLLHIIVIIIINLPQKGREICDKSESCHKVVLWFSTLQESIWPACSYVWLAVPQCLWDNVINKTCSSINVEGHNLVKCFCVNPTCDWLTDSSNNLPKYSKNLTVSFFWIDWRWPLSGKPPLRILQRYIWLLIPVAEFPAT